jgi:hypothetical protein
MTTHHAVSLAWQDLKMRSTSINSLLLLLLFAVGRNSLHTNAVKTSAGSHLFPYHRKLLSASV